MWQARPENLAVLILGCVALGSVVLGGGNGCDKSKENERSASPQLSGAEQPAPKPTDSIKSQARTPQEVEADLRARYPSLHEDTPLLEWPESGSDFVLSEEADQLFEREVSLARKEMAKKEYQSAVLHFTRALRTGKSDPQALSERGYAAWLLGKMPEAASDFWSAAGQYAEDDLRGQIWYNLGLVFEGSGDAEMSRAAFAMSASLAPSNAARKKLGARSACRSSIKFGPEIAEAPGASISRGWLDVHGRLGLDGAPSTENEAKHTVCHSVSRSLGGPPADPEGVCAESSPWKVSCCSGIGGFMVREMDIVEFSEGQFFTLDHGMVGAWPRECQGRARPNVSVQGNWVIVSGDDSVASPNADFDPDTVPVTDGSEYMGDFPCRTSPPEKSVNIYRLTDAKRLLEVRSFSRTPPIVVIREKERDIKISGDGCAAIVPLQ